MFYLISIFTFLVLVGIAYFLGLLSEKLKLGRFLGYFLAGVGFSYMIEKYWGNFNFLKNINFIKFLNLFVYSYLGLYFFKSTEYFKYKLTKFSGSFSLFLAFVQAILLLGSFFYFWSTYNPLNNMNNLIPMILMSSLVSLRFLIKENDLKEIFSQTFLFGNLFIIIIILIYKPFYENSLIISIGISLILVGVLKSLEKLKNKNLKCSKRNKNLKEILADDLLPSYKFFFCIFAIFFILLSFLYKYNIIYCFAIILLISGFIVSNYLGKGIYNSLRLVKNFYLGEIFLCLYLGFNFNYLILLELKFILLSLLIIRLFVNIIIYLLLKIKYSAEYFSISRIFSVMPVFSVTILTIWGGFPNIYKSEIFSYFILMEVLSNILFNFFIKKTQKEVNQFVKEEDIKLTLGDLIDERIVIDMQVKNLKDAIKMLLSQLVKEGYFNNIKNLIPQVMEREESGSTGLGQGIAMPHFRLKSLQKPLVVYGKMKIGNSIDWDTPDKLGVTDIFLIASPKENTKLHIEVLEKINFFITNPKNIPALSKAYKNNDLKRFYEEYENQ